MSTAGHELGKTKRGETHGDQGKAAVIGADVSKLPAQAKVPAHADAQVQAVAAPMLVMHYYSRIVTQGQPWSSQGALDVLVVELG